MKKIIKDLLSILFCGVVLFLLACFAIKYIRDDINYSLIYGEWLFDPNAKGWRIVKEGNNYYPQFKGCNLGFRMENGFSYVDSRSTDPDPFYLGHPPLSFADSLSAKKWIEGM
ncbi:MAG: hypothetical protein WC998_05060 [Candidatus Paceibacterota bacterium]|jgi:hypothetical protein